MPMIGHYNKGTQTNSVFLGSKTERANDNLSGRRIEDQLLGMQALGYEKGCRAINEPIQPEIA